MAEGWDWFEVQALYRQWKAHPPVEVVCNGYFELPSLGDADTLADGDDAPMMETADAIAMFIGAGFGGGM